MSTPNYTKTCSQCQQTLEVSSFYTDPSKKGGVSGQCKECKKQHARKYRSDNVETVRARGREYAAQNAERVGQKKKDWYEANKARVLVGRAKYRADNPEKVRSARIAAYDAKAEYYRDQTAKWKAANPGAYKVWCRANAGRINARVAVRRAARIKATPAWADHDAIAAVYVEAARRRAAGEDVEVDHIVPLNGKLVRGLHVHYNLQIIPALENQRKKNSFTTA